MPRISAREKFRSAVLVVLSVALTSCFDGGDQGDNPLVVAPTPTLTPTPTPTPTPVAVSPSGNQCSDPALYPRYAMPGAPLAAPTATYVAATLSKPIHTYVPTFYHAGTPTYSIAPSLPTGLSLDPATGVLSGTPTSTSGPNTTYVITVNTDLGQSYQCDFQLNVSAAGAATKSTATSAMAATRSSPVSTLLSDGRVLVLGGTSGGRLRSAEIYDPSTGNFTMTAQQMSRYGALTATLLSDSTVLIAGGYTTAGGTTAKLDLEVFDPATGTFTVLGASLAQHPKDAILLSNGKVLFLGGASACDTNAGTYTSYAAEIYDPSTQAVTAAGFLGGSSGTLLQDGTVLVRGYQSCVVNAVTGAYSTVSTATAKRFDPSNGSLSATGSSYVFPSTTYGPPPRKGLARADGTVLFADFHTSAGQQVFQTYDPVAGVFSTDIESPSYDAGVPIKVQTDGTILLASPGKLLFNTYAPSTGTLSYATSVMVYNHGSNASIVVLSGGQVLILGESDYGDLYTP